MLRYPYQFTIRHVLKYYTTRLEVLYVSKWQADQRKQTLADTDLINTNKRLITQGIPQTLFWRNSIVKTGVVKWFNNAKGYGFVLDDESAEDIFAHYSSIEMEGYRTLRAGQCVAFEAIDGPKGLHAMSIKVLEEVDVKGLSEDAADAQLTEPTTAPAPESA